MVYSHRWVAAIVVGIAIAAVAGWYAWAIWSAPPALPVAFPPKPAVTVEWPEIDCTLPAHLQPTRYVPSAHHFLLKVKLKNLPPGEEDGRFLFIAFNPLPGTADDKQRWYYGGAVFHGGRDEAGIWIADGEASITTNRQRQMRAAIQLSPGKTFVEVPVEVSSAASE